MKLFLLSFSIVLFSCGCSSANGFNVRTGKTKTRFCDLDDDVLYIIFSKLDLTDLVSLVEVDSRLSGMANDVFRPKHKHSQLEILAHRRESIEEKTVPPFKKDRNQLIINDVGLALSVLKYFGSNFQKITFSYVNKSKMNDLLEIIEFLNDNGSKTLKTLDLNIAHDFLEKFTRSFEAVEELNICSHTIKFNESIQLNDLFPKLRRLNLKSIGVSHFSFISSTFSHLEHFSLRLSNSNDVTNIESVKELIRKNPTIRSIAARLDDPGLVAFTNQHLPNIENLTICSAPNDSVRFESVENFDFTSGDASSIDKLSMPRIESLKMIYDPKHLNKWMAFFKNHTQLRQLHIREKYLGNIYKLLRIFDQFTAHLTHLIDVSLGSFVCNQDAQIESIVAFFENHKHLNSCRFLDGDFEPEHQQILRERLANEWNIDFKRGSFRRKHPALE